MLKHILLSFIFIVIITSLSGCSGNNNSPLAVYNKFQEACDIGDLATGESLVTDAALEYAKSSDYDVCINFMPDGFQRFGSSLGIKPDWTASEVIPEVEINGNTAYLRWEDPSVDFRDIMMAMYQIDGKWKIEETKYFEH
jgi:hypothetical protein